ncbi:MAG: hypothetical protein JNJ83_10950 [Verrucomicrobiaceae bacterium]|nr:hypothetical protein [Verrucomicrobiaceae bacterium]
MRELKLHTAEFERAVGRVLASSRRDASDVMYRLMRSVMRRVVEITPPGSEGVKGGTRKAQQQGQAAVAADIRKVYGNAGDAYDLLAERSAARASAFWMLHKSGDDNAASEMLRSSRGVSFSPFDDGKAHKAMMDKRGRVGGKKGKRPIFYVRNGKELADYIKEKQSHVYWLAAGWKEAMTKLGGTVPQMIAVHDAPGAIEFLNEGGRWVLRAHNDVRFASNVNDLERRIQWALDSQTQALIRQWDHFVKNQAIKQNFKAS